MRESCYLLDLSYIYGPCILDESSLFTAEYNHMRYFEHRSPVDNKCAATFRAVLAFMRGGMARLHIRSAIYYCPSISWSESFNKCVDNEIFITPWNGKSTTLKKVTLWW